jgi:hydrogenase-4 component E
MDYISTLMVALMMTNLWLLGTSRIASCIRIVALQGLFLGALPLLLRQEGATLRFLILTVGSIGLRGIVFPWLLLRALRDVNARREVEPYVGYTVSIIVGILALMLSLWLDTKIALPGLAPSPLMVPAALATMFVGLFLIISRKKALTQILGYIILENGIYTLGLAMIDRMPMLVELGVLLDAFVAVFVMSVATYRISREFDHIDIEKLDTLKG